MYISCCNITSRHTNKEIKTVVRGSCLINVICIIYAYGCSTRCEYHMMFVLFRSSTPTATSGTVTVYRSGASAYTSVFFLVYSFFIWRGIMLLSFYCSVVFCRSCLFFCPFGLSVLLRSMAFKYSFGIVNIF
jgi:hypothetical protein